MRHRKQDSEITATIYRERRRYQTDVSQHLGVCNYVHSEITKQYKKRKLKRKKKPEKQKKKEKRSNLWLIVPVDTIHGHRHFFSAICHDDLFVVIVLEIFEVPISIAKPPTLSDVFKIRARSIYLCTKRNGTSSSGFCHLIMTWRSMYFDNPRRRPRQVPCVSARCELRSVSCPRVSIKCTTTSWTITLTSRRPCADAYGRSADDPDPSPKMWRTSRFFLVFRVWRYLFCMFLTKCVKIKRDKVLSWPSFTDNFCCVESLTSFSTGKCCFLTVNVILHENVCSRMIVTYMCVHRSYLRVSRSVFFTSFTAGLHPMQYHSSFRFCLLGKISGST